MLLIFSLCLFPFAAAAAAPHIYDVPQAGPPSSQAQVLGNGFDPNATLDVYFDGTDVGVVDTDNNGSFGMALKAPTIRQNGLTIQIPNDAVPGEHWITAVERITQLQAQVPFNVSANWAQYHFDAQHTGFNPYENVLSPGTVGNLTPRWTRQIGGGNGINSPTVADGMIYVGSVNGDWHLYALDASTGDPLWSFWAQSWNSPAVANGILYFTSCDTYNNLGDLIALNAKSGGYLWSYSLGHSCGSHPSVANGVVYFSGYDPNIYALDASSGAVLWKYTGDVSFGTPTLADGIIYVGSSDYNLYALDAGTGTPIWKFPTGWSDDGGTPAVANGVVYATSFDEPTNGTILYALEGKTGALIWKHAFIGAAFDPAVANGVVYVGVGAYDDKLYALDAASGAVLWMYALPEDAGGASIPSVANGVAYFPANWNNYRGTLYALNAMNGVVLWQYTAINGGYGPPPAVVDGRLYIGDGSGDLEVFGLPNQQMAEKFSPPERPDPSRLTPNWSLQPNKIVTPLLKK